MTGSTRQWLWTGLLALAGLILLALLNGAAETPGADSSSAAVGEARTGALTVALPKPVGDIAVTQARLPGRPIVLLDPGHGGRDPGATSLSGTIVEKNLTLALARELRALLKARGRVRVALTRDDDRYVSLDQRAEIAGRLGAALFVSLHGDSAPNPLARGATVYSLSDVASSAEAARYAASENAAGGALGSDADGSVRAILADFALRGQMEQSAALADRIIRRASGPVLLRPRPHQFAAFHVLRRAGTPAVLVEVGYLSNAEDELLLADPKQRAPMLLALAQAIEADVATAQR